MFRDSEPADPVRPCAVCGLAGPNCFYEVGLCDAHLTQWLREAPPLESLEHEHAEQHPEDVVASGQHQWVDNKRWFILKPGLTEQLSKTAATSWLLRLKARAA
jgi:hypothetical protein